MKRDDAIWLVKSAGRVTGPHTAVEIAKLLKDKDISVVDEVSEPFRRWLMIRECQAFQAILDQLRASGSALDDITNITGSVTGSVTENLTGSFDGDITEDIGEFQNQMKEIVYEDVQESRRPTVKNPTLGRFQSAGNIDQHQIRIEAEKSSRWMWGLTLLVFLAVGVSIGLKKVMKPKPAAMAGFSSFAGLGLALYNDGDYSAALEILKKAHADDPERKDIWLPLALMLIQIDGQTVEARRLIQKVIDERVENAAVSYNAMALAHLNDGDTAKAAENIKKAEEGDRDFLPLKVNQGVVHLMTKEYDLARKSLNQALRGGMRDGAVITQFAVAQVLTWRDSNEKTALGEALRVVSNHQRMSLDYQQELRLVQTYLEYLRGETTGLEPKFRRILDVDPQQSEDFRHPIHLSRQMADWGQLGQWCKQLSDVGGDAPEAAALGAVCEFKQGRAVQAQSLIEKAVNQAPRDSLLQAVYAAILRSAGFGGEASVALGRAVEFDRRNENLLPVLLQARFCQERDDYDCAKTYWLKVLELEPKQPAAKIGMAQIYNAKGAGAEAPRLLQEIGASAPEYKPFLKMRRQLANAKKGG